MGRGLLWPPPLTKQGTLTQMTYPDINYEDRIEAEAEIRRLYPELDDGDRFRFQGKDFICISVKTVEGEDLIAFPLFDSAEGVAPQLLGDSIYYDGRATAPLIPFSFSPPLTRSLHRLSMLQFKEKEN